MPLSAGYSGTPLAKKLGIKPSNFVWIANEPDGFRDLLEPLPDGIEFQQAAAANTDIAHVFLKDRSELERLLVSLRKKLKAEVSLWVSWPKKASKVPTTITEDVIRELALPLGWVDVKVCAIDGVWSGLKLVVRKELR